MAVCARLNPSDYSGCVPRAPVQKANFRTIERLPVITDDHGAVVASQMATAYFRPAATEMEAEVDNEKNAWEHGPCPHDQRGLGSTPPKRALPDRGWPQRGSPPLTRRRAAQPKAGLGAGNLC